MTIHAQLDHVVLLLPYDNIINPPSWLVDNFTLSPGGRHGDNKTENRLVIFADGTYLELIAFINDDPEKRRGHWWDRPYGVVDYALTIPQPLDYDALVGRLDGTQISYAEPKFGGRSTGGHDIKWRVIFPSGIGRGNAPFFCEDVTDRQWRVPVSEQSTTHPCGALGMAGVLLEVQQANLERLSKANAAAVDEAKASENQYAIDAPIKVDKLKRPSIRLQKAAAGSTRDLALTLILQTGTAQAKEPIRERIEDGLINIVFE